MKSTQNWANLSTDLVKIIADLLLADDVTEYVRLRAVCHSWRSCTDDPKNLDGRFHPNKWIMLTPLTAPPTAAFDFIKLSTGKKYLIDLLELRRGYSLVYVVDGLCLLKNKQTQVLALLNPFTRFLTNLPKHIKGHNCQPVPFVIQNALGTLSGVYITSSSMVLLRFDIGSRGDCVRLVYAKPGDLVWLSIDMKFKVSDSMLYRDKFYVIAVEKGLVQINFDHKINSRTRVVMDVVIPCGPSLQSAFLINSYLVECDGKVILVAVPKIFQVDLEERSLVSIELIDGYALFLSSQRSMSIYCKNLFCSHDNYIYFCEKSHNVLNEPRTREQMMAPFFIQYARLQPAGEAKYSSTIDPSELCPHVVDLVRYQNSRGLHTRNIAPYFVATRIEVMGSVV